MSTIYSSLPNDWRDLQNKVAQILQECGFSVDIQKDINTVRGIVNIDVIAQDITRKPISTYLCECKHWQTRVPKSVVHSFRTVVADYGANWGFIISSGGFQRGACEAAVKTNIRLLVWEEFQEIFVNQWIVKYMLPRIHKVSDPLIKYTEPTNPQIFHKAKKLDPVSYNQFVDLRNKYTDLAHLTSPFRVVPLNMRHRILPYLPLRNIMIIPHVKWTNIPDDLLDAVSLRDFLDILCNHLEEGINVFDHVFGERA